MRALLSSLPVRAVGRKVTRRSDLRRAHRHPRRSMSGTLTLPEPTWFVGCGNMGGAIVEGWRMGELDLSPITVIRPSGKQIEGVRVVTSASEAPAGPELVMLAFKPQTLAEIAPELQRF